MGNRGAQCVVRLSEASGPGRAGRFAPRTAWGGAFVRQGWRSGEARDEVARQQAPPDQVEIGEPEHREGPGQILFEPAIPHFGEAPEAFDHMKRMLAPGPLLRSPPVGAPLRARQPPVWGAFRFTRYRPPLAVQCCRSSSRQYAWSP